MRPSGDRNSNSAESANEQLPTVARLHTASVAAIALVGEPKIDEPLIEAWRRTLVQYEIQECPTEEWARTHQLDEAPTRAWALTLANDRELRRHIRLRLLRRCTPT